MTIHMVKLCVGADTVDDLVAWQRHLMQTHTYPLHHTRMMPKRRDDLLDGGSIYWVIKRAIRVRQRLLDIRELTDREGRSACELVLDPHLVATERRPRRPFQGWRYLKPAEAPRDLDGAAPADIPADLDAALKAALVW